MISLIVTTYNHAFYIREALNSVVAQGISDLQVIIVDDGSTDGTFEIAREYEKLGFDILSKPNGGPSSALNYGVSRANGDFIVLLSGDDKLLPDSIAQRVSVLRNNRASIVSTIPEWIDSGGTVLPELDRAALFKQYHYDRPMDMFSDLFNNGNMICAPSVAMTRSCWNTVGLFNEDLWQLQDYEYWLRACAKSQYFYCLTNACISYRWHGKNLSLSNPEASAKEMDFILLTAPDFLDREMLITLLWGADKKELASVFDTKLLRALLRMKHARRNVREGGRWQLRTISMDSNQREVLLKNLF